MMEVRVQWRAIVNALMDFLIFMKGWQFLDQLREYEAQNGSYLMESDAKKNGRLQYSRRLSVQLKHVHLYNVAVTSKITKITLRKGVSNAYAGESHSVPWTFRVLFPAL